MSLCVAPPAPPPRACPVAAPPPATARTAPDPAVGMVAAAQRPETTLAASPSSYVRSWADSVGRLDVQVLAATPPGLRYVDPALADTRWRLRPLTARYVPPVTKPYVYPSNRAPPAWFLPQSTADLWQPVSWARRTAWVHRHWPYILACSVWGADAVRGSIPTEVFTTKDLAPGARGVIWDCRSSKPVPLDFDKPIDSHLHTTFLDEALREYPDQELRSFMTKGVATKTDAGTFAMALGPHLTTLAAGMSEVEESVAGLVAKRWYGSFIIKDVPMPFTPMYGIPQGSTLKADLTRRRTSD